MGNETGKKVALKVTGRVQGVGFRWWARSEARSLGLSGWIWNHADGSVRLIMEGEPGPMAEFGRALWKGPPAARVDRVAAEASDVRVPEGEVRIGAPPETSGGDS